MKQKIIHGHAFQISQPYAEGHTLTAAEAKALNQVRAENIGNNLREQIKELLEAGKDADAEARVAEYDAQYSFAMGGGERVVKDPVEREAMKIAKEQVKAALAKKGRKISDVPEGMTEDEWKAKLEDNYEKVAAMDVVLEAAKKAVAAKKKQADSLAAAINLDA